MSSEQITDVCLRPQTIELLGENAGRKPPGTALRSTFVAPCPWARAAEEKNRQDYIKRKSFFKLSFKCVY